jgi:hypothetical protein
MVGETRMKSRVDSYLRDFEKGVIRKTFVPCITCGKPAHNKQCSSCFRSHKFSGKISRINQRHRLARQKEGV